MKVPTLLKGAALAVFMIPILAVSEGHCPRCAKIEGERAANPPPAAGYYDEQVKPAHASEKPTVSTEKPAP